MPERPEYRTFASVGTTREVLEAFGLQAKYSFGQNFLVNDGVLRKIIALADISEGDRVLEIGPGIGTLTRALLHAGADVLSVEYDADLLPVLAQTCAPWAKRFTLLHADAAKLSPDDETVRAFAPTKLVANLPYEVASAVVLRTFESFPGIGSATFMVQREVADRMTATPGNKDYGAYTVKLALHAQPSGRFEVPASNFYPQPRVQSAVLRLDRAVRRDAADAPLDDAVLRAAGLAADAAFATRRKTIANSAKAFFAQHADGCDISLDAFMAALAACGIEPSRRGETLAVTDFIQLGCALR